MYFYTWDGLDRCACVIIIMWGTLLCNFLSRCVCVYVCVHEVCMDPTHVCYIAPCDQAWRKDSDQSVVLLHEVILKVT